MWFVFLRLVLIWCWCLWVLACSRSAHICSFHPIAKITLFIWSPPRGGLKDHALQQRHWGWGGGVVVVTTVAAAAVMRGWAWWWWWWEGKGRCGSVWTSITWFGKWWAAALALVICWLYFLPLEMLLWCSWLECWAINLCGLRFNFWTLHFFLLYY